MQPWGTVNQARAKQSWSKLNPKSATTTTKKIYILYIYENKCVPFKHRHLMQSRLIGKVKPDGAARSNCHWEFSAIPGRSDINRVWNSHGVDKQMRWTWWNEMKFPSGYLHFYTSAIPPVTLPVELTSWKIGELVTKRNLDTDVCKLSLLLATIERISKAALVLRCKLVHCILVHWLVSIRFLSQKSAKCGQGNEMSLAVPKFHGSVFG